MRGKKSAETVITDKEKEEGRITGIEREHKITARKVNVHIFFSNLKIFKKISINLAY